MWWLSCWVFSFIFFNNVFCSLQLQSLNLSQLHHFSISFFCCKNIFVFVFWYTILILQIVVVDLHIKHGGRFANKMWQLCKILCKFFFPIVIENLKYWAIFGRVTVAFFWWNIPIWTSMSKTFQIWASLVKIRFVMRALV
jgi:hypothetical protein